MIVLSNGILLNGIGGIGSIGGIIATIFLLVEK
jgi:proteasome assembly chaperone (PAC2) family protein